MTAGLTLIKARVCRGVTLHLNGRRVRRYTFSMWRLARVAWLALRGQAMHASQHAQRQARLEARLQTMQRLRSQRRKRGKQPWEREIWLD